MLALIYFLIGALFCCVVCLTYLTVEKLKNDKANEAELISTEPTYDDIAELFEELDNEAEILEERAENRVENLDSHKVNLYGKCI